MLEGDNARIGCTSCGDAHIAVEAHLALQRKRRHKVQVAVAVDIAPGKVISKEIVGRVHKDRVGRRVGNRQQTRGLDAIRLVKEDAHLVGKETQRHVGVTVAVYVGGSHRGRSRCTDAAGRAFEEVRPLVAQQQHRAGCADGVHADEQIGQAVAVKIGGLQARQLRRGVKLAVGHHRKAVGRGRDAEVVLVDEVAAGDSAVGRANSHKFGRTRCVNIQPTNAVGGARLRVAPDQRHLPVVIAVDACTHSGSHGQVEIAVEVKISPVEVQRAAQVRRIPGWRGGDGRGGDDGGGGHVGNNFEGDAIADGAAIDTSLLEEGEGRVLDSRAAHLRHNTRREGHIAERANGHCARQFPNEFARHRHNLAVAQFVDDGRGRDARLGAERALNRVQPGRRHDGLEADGRKRRAARVRNADAVEEQGVVVDIARSRKGAAAVALHGHGKCGRIGSRA